MACKVLILKTSNSLKITNKKLETSMLNTK